MVCKHGEAYLCGLSLMFIVACILCDCEIDRNVSSTGIMLQFLYDFTWVPSSYESDKFKELKEYTASLKDDEIKENYFDDQL